MPFGGKFDNSWRRGNRSAPASICTGVENVTRAGRDREFTDYVGARSGWLRRIAFLLCQDWDYSDDLVQAAFTSLYVHWGRIRGADHLDAYTRTILVRVYLSEQRSGWARKVTLAAWLPEELSEVTDQETALDVRAALASLPPRQRATIVLRYYCDLNVDQTATALGCSAGTVKSQTSKGLVTLRQALEQPAAARAGRPRPALPRQLAARHLEAVPQGALGGDAYLRSGAWS
jgi:RNA polymerase sigma-70 factor (sigma-E family)